MHRLYSLIPSLLLICLSFVHSQSVELRSANSSVCTNETILFGEKSAIDRIYTGLPQLKTVRQQSDTDIPQNVYNCYYIHAMMDVSVGHSNFTLGLGPSVHVQKISRSLDLSAEYPKSFATPIERPVQDIGGSLEAVFHAINAKDLNVGISYRWFLSQGLNAHTLNITFNINQPSERSLI